MTVAISNFEHEIVAYAVMNPVPLEAEPALRSRVGVASYLLRDGAGDELIVRLGGTKAMLRWHDHAVTALCASRGWTIVESSITWDDDQGFDELKGCDWRFYRRSNGDALEPIQ